MRKASNPGSAWDQTISSYLVLPGTPDLVVGLPHDYKHRARFEDRREQAAVSR